MDARPRDPRKRVLIIANPTAGRLRRDRCRDFLACLERLGCSVTLRETSGRGDGERLAAEAVGAGFDVTVAAGGDGTINEVLNGLRRDGPPLAILPLGTVNVLAKEIGLPRSIDAIARTVASGPVRMISLGEANGRRFAVMASVGLDAQVIERIDLGLKRYVGRYAYLHEAVRQSLTSRPVTYRLRIDGRDYEASGAIIANGRHYAGRYVTTPDADLHAPCLQVCRMTKAGRLAAPSYFASLVCGRLGGRSDFHVHRTTCFDIVGPADLPLQADGDLIGRLPATVRVLPNALSLVFPDVTASYRST